MSVETSLFCLSLNYELHHVRHRQTRNAFSATNRLRQTHEVSNQTLTKLNTAPFVTHVKQKRKKRRMSNEKNKLNDTKFIMRTVKLAFECCALCGENEEEARRRRRVRSNKCYWPAKELISWRVNISHRLTSSSSAILALVRQHAHFLSHHIAS